MMLLRYWIKTNSIYCAKRFASTKGFDHNEISRLSHVHWPILSVDENAKQLGFNTKEEMYPEYPLEEPPKLWLIVQRETMQMRPWWEKDVMRYMGLYDIGSISIQMNTEKVNDKIWIVKHLVRVVPILFPQGLPTVEDIGHTKLKLNGEFIIKTKMKENTQDNEDKIPTAPLEDFKVVDGFRMCGNCSQKNCKKWNMCQKLWLQGKRNPITKLGPRMFNYLDNPLKNSSTAESQS